MLAQLNSIIELALFDLVLPRVREVSTKILIVVETHESVGPLCSVNAN